MVRGIARIFPWGDQSDCFYKEMFTSSRQTGTYQWMLYWGRTGKGEPGPPGPPLATPLKVKVNKDFQGHFKSCLTIHRGSINTKMTAWRCKWTKVQNPINMHQNYPSCPCSLSGQNWNIKKPNEMPAKILQSPKTPKKIINPKFLKLWNSYNPPLFPQFAPPPISLLYGRATTSLRAM